MELQLPQEADREPQESSADRDLIGTALPHLLEMNEKLDRAREEERLALAREMHDDVGGTLSAVKLRLLALCKHNERDPLAGELHEIAGLIEDTLQATDRIIRALRPGILDEGLVAAVQWEAGEFERRCGIRCTFSSTRPAIDIPKGQSLAVYRICQESLTNIAKHAGARHVEVQLHRDANAVTLEVTDDGCGFDVDVLDQTNRLGVRGMRERALGYGGWSDINSARGRGTTVVLSIPLRRVQDVQA